MRTLSGDSEGGAKLTPGCPCVSPCAEGSRPLGDRKSDRLVGLAPYLGHVVVRLDRGLDQRFQIRHADNLTGLLDLCPSVGSNRGIRHEGSELAMTVYLIRDPDTCGGRGALKIGYTEKHSIDRLKRLFTNEGVARV